MMNKLCLLSFVILLPLLSFAQIQKGIVKTRGRMVDGQLLPGHGLKGASVSVRGRNTVFVDNDNGEFSFPVPDKQFRIDSVVKKNYQLVDMDVCSRFYEYSENNPVYILMETPYQILIDKQTAESNFRLKYMRQLQKKVNEIENLKAEQKITDAEYKDMMDQLYNEQENNERMIEDMAKRYAELDYDQLDDFYRQVSYSIERGDLDKADSLLSLQGDIVEQTESLKKHGKVITDLHKAEIVQHAQIEEVARRCYSYHEICSLQHLNDSAAYYLELRASLDTTNVQWLDEAGEYILYYISDDDRVLRYYKKALDVLESMPNENYSDIATHNNNIGYVYLNKRDPGNAMNHFKYALDIWKRIYGENTLEVATCYDNIGGAYNMMRNCEDSALYYYKKALEIRLNIGEDYQAVANSLTNIGTKYYFQGHYDKALEYYEKALTIRLSVLEENHPDVAQSYYDIGWWYEFHSHGNYKEAMDNYQKALIIWQNTFGDKHEKVKKTKGRISEVENKINDLKNK